MTSGGPIRIILAVQPGLVRGALAYVLRTYEDIDVVAEIGCPEGIVNAASEATADVLVVDLDLAAPPVMPAVAQVLVLAHPRPKPQLTEALAKRRPGMGFLSKNAAPARVAEAIRRIVGGETVLDGELVAATLASRSPLTAREAEVLAIAAGGWPVRQIAEKLSLSEGTVRNHLSRALAKTRACSRIEAVRIAREAGWI